MYILAYFWLFTSISFLIIRKVRFQNDVDKKNYRLSMNITVELNLETDGPIRQFLQPPCLGKGISF